MALALTDDKLGVDPSKCIFWEKEYDKRIAKQLSNYSTVTQLSMDSAIR